MAIPIYTVLPYCVIMQAITKEIPIITYGLWCTRLLASLMCRYGLVKKWVKDLTMRQNIPDERCERYILLHCQIPFLCPTTAIYGAGA